MFQKISIPLLAIALILLPFWARTKPGAAPSPVAAGEARILVVITAHNEAIRREFGAVFSAWHQRKFGSPVEIRWVDVGGSSEIARYLEAQYVSAVRAWWTRSHGAWPAGAGAMLVQARPPDPASAPSPDAPRLEQCAEIYRNYRVTDRPDAFTCKADVLFGGGSFDHQRAMEAGFIVPAWPSGHEPAGLFKTLEGEILIPSSLGGEDWCGPAYYGAAASVFGLFYNPDRLRDLGISHPPATWEDLADPAYAGTLAAADPTKSGSIAKSYEMIVHQQMALAVERAGFSGADIDHFEAAYARTRLPRGERPEGVPAAYLNALETGWMDGLKLLQRMGANARYFSDTSSKLPVDVSNGSASAGMGIDFTAQRQAEITTGRDGSARLVFVVPKGGTSVSADPISILRGAEHRETAVRFIEFVLGEEGQRLWCYRPGTEGGPVRFSLRRLPVRRDFYPSDDPVLQAAFARRAAQGVRRDDEGFDPYAFASTLAYRPRWTRSHFAPLRDVFKAMCLDSDVELKKAWFAILANGGPDRQPKAMGLMQRFPEAPASMRWSALVEDAAKCDRIKLLREWTIFFRNSYREAAATCEASPQKSQS